MNLTLLHRKSLFLNLLYGKIKPLSVYTIISKFLFSLWVKKIFYGKAILKHVTYHIRPNQNFFYKFVSKHTKCVTGSKVIFWSSQCIVFVNATTPPQFFFFSPRILSLRGDKATHADATNEESRLYVAQRGYEIVSESLKKNRLRLEFFTAVEQFGDKIFFNGSDLLNLPY